jgi:tRNA-dihydrouridine synthase
VLRHFEEQLAFVGKELPGVREFRRHFGWYSHGLSGAAAFRSAVNKLDDADAVRKLARDFFSGAFSERRLQSVDDAEVDYRAAYG